jgi:cytochrome b561
MRWWLYVLMLLSRLAAFKYLSLQANLSAVFAFLICQQSLPKSQAVVAIFQPADGIIWIALVIAVIGHVGAAPSLYADR